MRRNDAMADLSRDQPLQPATSGLAIAVVLFFLLIVASLWVGVQYVTARERAHRIAEVKRENANIARVLEEHTIRTLAYVDELALLIKERYEREGNRLDLPALFGALKVPKALVHDAVITDESGQIVLGSHGAPPGWPGDREHLRVHERGDSGRILIGKPVPAHVNGRRSIVVTRRANKPDGSLLGVVGLAIDPYYFSDLYKDVDLGRDGVVSLVGTDGVIRARLPHGQPRGTGTDISHAALFQRIGATPAGSFVGSGATDEVERIYSYRSVRDYPLIVVVGTSLRESLEAVADQQRTYQMLAGALTVLLSALAYALVHLVRRRDHAEAAARRYLDELHRKANQLEAARAEAEAGSRAKSQFLATMSHEIRTPMNGVMGMLELLQRSRLEPDQKNFARVAYDSAAGLLRVLNDVLDFSRMEAGRLTFDNAPFDPRTPLSDVAALFGEAARAKGIELRLQVADDVPQAVIGDAGRLRQVLTNLVSNALKFTSSGAIEARLARVPHDPPDIAACRLRFEVSDTGIGLSDEEQRRVFAPFTQADASTTRRYGGTGLGLAICKHLVELMDGAIGVHSARERGSTFWFEVTLQDATERRVVAPAPVPRSAAAG
jgi:signal transduction histidine kinase